MRNINKGTPEQMLQAFQDKLAELGGVAGSTSVNASSVTAGEYPNIQEFQDIVNYYCGYDNMSYEEVYDQVMQDYDNESLAEDVASAVEEYWENGGCDDEDIYGASESPIATYYVSGDISILIYGIEYSVDDLVKWAWSNDPSNVQVSTIEYDEEGKPYFDAEGVTVDLGEAIKACSVEGSTSTANEPITASTDSEIDRVLDIISEQGVSHYTARPKISNYAGDRFLEVDLRSGDMSVWSYEVPLEDVEYDLSCGYTPEEIATNILTDAMSDLNGGLDAFLEDDDDPSFMYDVDACSITGSEDMDTITDIEDRGEYISALSNAINDELASNGLSSTCKAEDSSVKVIVSDGDKITEFDVPNNDLKWDWNGMQDDVQYIAAEVVSEFADTVEGSTAIEAARSEWDKLKNKLIKEDERGIDSIAEFTEAGDELLSYCYDVEGDLGLEPDVSMSDGVYMYNEYGEEISEPIDYYDFNTAIFNCAIDSSSPEEFKSKYRSYLEGVMGSAVESATAIESDISIEPGGEYSDDDFEDDPYEPNVDYVNYPPARIEEIAKEIDEDDIDFDNGFYYNLSEVDPSRRMELIEDYDLVEDEDNPGWYYVKSSTSKKANSKNY